jgi:hypothetical protein
LETGNPLTVTTLGDNLNTGGGYLQVPNRTGEPNLPAGDRTRSKFFNTDVFQRPALYVIGNGGPQYPDRSWQPQPGSLLQQTVFAD